MATDSMHAVGIVHVVFRNVNGLHVVEETKYLVRIV
jgi:hypothetical protein